LVLEAASFPTSDIACFHVNPKWLIVGDSFLKDSKKEELRRATQLVIDNTHVIVSVNGKVVLELLPGRFASIDAKNKQMVYDLKMKASIVQPIIISKGKRTI